MNARTVVTASLLLFVVAAVLASIIRDRSGATPEGPAAPVSHRGVVVWYLHGDTRCTTCRKIEATARSALDKSLTDDLTSGRLVWRVTNYDQPENEHFMDDYDLASPSLLLVHEGEGPAGRWENLDRIWELVGDTSSFEEYVVSKVRTFQEMAK